MTKDEVIAQARRRYPSMSPAQAAILFDAAHKRLCLSCQIRDSSVVISLTEGQREFDLPTDLVRIAEAYYVQSSTSKYPLEETSKPGLIVKQRGWRMIVSEQRPFRYYVASVPDGSTSKMVVGFEYVSEETTTGGYPNVTLYYTSHLALSGDDDVPPQLPSEEVYTDEMYRRWCKENDAANYPFWETATIKSLQDAKDATERVQDESAESDFVSTSYLSLSRVR